MFVMFLLRVLAGKNQLMIRSTFVGAKLVQVLMLLDFTISFELSVFFLYTCNRNIKNIGYCIN